MVKMPTPKPSSSLLPSKKEDPDRRRPVIPSNLEELKTLLGEEGLPKKKDELDWLLKWSHDMVEKKGADWVKKNRFALLRQWEYIRNLL